MDRPSGIVPSATARTDREGRFELLDLGPGELRLRVTLEGFEPRERVVLVRPGQSTEVDLELTVRRRESLNVSAAPEGGTRDPTLGPHQELSGAILERSPSGEDSIEAALVTLPGVVPARTSLSIRGGRLSQSGMQLGSMSLADPGTGEARLRMPVDAVAAVQVLPSPSAAELGRFTSGLVLMQPRTGTDRWQLELGNFDPTLRFERGAPLHVLGLRSFAPRLAVRGPLVPGRLYLAQSLQYRYSADDVRSRPEDELTRRESLASVTRLDWQAAERHRVSALLSLFPERREQVNLGTFIPPETTYDQKLLDSRVSVSHEWTMGSRAVLSSAIHAGGLRIEVSPPKDGAMVVAPAEYRGRWFNRQERRSSTLQWVETLTLASSGPLGDHVTVLGFDALRVGFEGESASAPVEVRRVDGTLARRVTFPSPARPRLDTLDLAFFARDRWSPPVRGLTLDAGARLDRDAVCGETVLAPRLGVTYQPRGGRLTLQAGAGLFTERTPSLVGSFLQLEERTEARFAEDGQTLVGATHYHHEVDTTLRAARSTTWNAGLTFRATPKLDLWVGVMGRDGRHEPILVPEGEGREGRLRLETTGRSRYRDLELGIRFAPRPGREARLSWVHSRSEADLNAFGSIFGTVPAVVVRPNEYGPAPSDIPDRVLLRVVSDLGPDWLASTLFEWRQGLPWSAVNENLEFVGPRNQSGRLPSAMLIDFTVERRFEVRRRSLWLGVGVTNLLNSRAWQDVQTFVEADDFGWFYNEIPRRLHVVVRLGG